MAHLVGCPQCGATHRVVAAQTRLTCDYCRTQIAVAERTGVQELVIPVKPSARRAREEAGRQLRARGVHEPQIELGKPRFVPMWYLSSRAGEEFVVPGSREQIPLLRSVGIPGAPLVTRESVRTLADFPEPDVTRKDAEAAAHNAFTEGDRTLSSLRLIWMPVIPLKVDLRRELVSGLYVAGADRVYFDPLPATATDAPVKTPLLMAYVAFLFVAVLVGALVGPLGRRAVAELAVLGAGIGLWTLWIQKRWSSS